MSDRFRGEPLAAASLTLGAVLAGGASRRMGGGEKAFLGLAGRALLDRIAGRLAGQCAALVLSANGDSGRFARFGLPVVPDALPARPGPLAGILAALDWAAAQRPGIGWVASVTCDAPFIPDDLVRRLHDARLAAGAALACAMSGGQIHPVHALWPVALRDDLRAALARGELSVGRYAARHGVAIAAWDVAPFDPFLNVNTPDDLRAAERLLAAFGDPDQRSEA